VSSVERVLERLERVKKNGGGWEARCPAHEDRQPSLRVGEGADGRVLLKCHAGCTVEAIVAAVGLELRDLFAGEGEGGRYPSKDGATVQRSPEQRGCTLADYASAKGLPVDFLAALGVDEIRHTSAPAVRFTYLDAEGEVACTRYRVSLTGEITVRTKAGDKHCLYGLNRLERARQAGYVVIVEGESDTHTLWLHDYPALGLPGANGWNENRDADHLDGVDAVYVLIEPDRGGEAVLEWLRSSKIQGRVKLVRLENAKDVSELYLAGPERFRERFEAALQAATPWAEHERVASDVRRRQAWASCEELAREPRILDLLAANVRRLGLVGEDRLVKLTYLTVTSRLFERIVSQVVKGPSSAGKSYLIGQVLRFFRPELDYYAHTGMSERALVFGEESLEHKMLVLYEAEGLEEGFHAYIVRSLLSEGRISYPITEKGADGKHRTRTVVRDGPTGLLVTTTAVQLHPENETRLISLVADDSAEQTGRVLQSLAAEAEMSVSAPVDFAPWHALQAWLAEETSDVRVPFAVALADMVPPAAVRLRRDFGAVLGLIKAHALLHRASRDFVDGCTVATIDDYAAVRVLVADLVAQGVEATVSAATRETVAAVSEAADPEGVSLTLLAKRLQLDKGTVSRRWRVARDGGYLRNLEDQRGKPARIVLGDPLPDELEILPSAETLRVRCVVAPGEEPEDAGPGGPDHDDWQEEIDRHRELWAESEADV
jgi:hypothetical protein